MGAQVTTLAKQYSIAKDLWTIWPGYHYFDNDPCVISTRTSDNYWPLNHLWPCAIHKATVASDVATWGTVGNVITQQDSWMKSSVWQQQRWCQQLECGRKLCLWGLAVRQLNRKVQFGSNKGGVNKLNAGINTVCEVCAVRQLNRKVQISKVQL